jgi:prolyl oligopeptidase
MRPTVTLCLAAGLLASAGARAMTTDPNLWLEDVEGAKALDWVRAQNAESVKAIAQAPGFTETRDYLRSVLDSDAKIPVVEKIGPYYYNFWKDKNHAAGLWRRTTPADYRNKNPNWETVLDLDALNAAENKAKDRADYVWHGANCLPPEYKRCLLALSRGGSDADETREFDLGTKAFVQDGFFRPEAKGSLSWHDANSVFVSTDFGAGSMTTSGYARIVKLWQRGTPMTAAKTLFSADEKDLGAQGFHDFAPGFERDFIWRGFAFYNNELYVLGKDGKPTRIDLPNSADKGVHREWLTVQLREPFTDGGKTYPAGSLLATNFDAFMKGKRKWEVIFTPTKTTSLAAAVWVKDFLLLNLLDDVKSEIEVWYPRPDGWDSSGLELGEDIADLAVAAVDADNSNEYWLTSTSFLTPTTLSLGEAGLRDPEVLKQLPAWFDASNMEVSQHFATSKDGTRVPYFQVSQKGIKLDGSNPTLLYGYGGFEVSLTPSYNGTAGKGWLEKGGVFVVANIRGGGEYGPRWHQAALKQNRHKAYEDFAAVAQDLVARKITSPRHLGAMGGSNGGLLTGNMLTQYPELFGAIVIQVPLLDMKRYSHLLAGASWMAEYGDPDTADWDYIKTFSPYQLFDPAKDYPATFIWTTTRDDRVHPGHARKMAAKMLAADKDVRYYENTEGGHGAGATNAQQAHVWALTYRFLWNELGTP